MTRISTRLLMFALLVSAAAFAQSTSTTPTSDNEKAGKWFLRAGVNFVPFHPGASVKAAGTPVPGGNVSLTNFNVTATVDVGYYVKPNLSVMWMGGIPPKTNIYGAGTLAPYGKLASLWWGPTVLSAQYHFGKGKLRPYIGPGIAYAIICRKGSAALTNPQVHNAFAPVAQAGAEYMFNKHWGAYVDFKEIWLSVDAHGKLSNVVPVSAHIRVYPTIASTGLKYQF